MDTTENPPVADLSTGALLQARIDALETRLARVERELHLEQEAAESHPPPVESAIERSDALELQIGTGWFAKLGIITLAIGFGFLLTLSYPSLPSFLPGLAGIVIAATLIVFTLRTQDSLAHISGYLLGGGVALMFFAVMRFSFFTGQPAIESKGVLAILLTATAGIGFFTAYRRGSAYLTALSLALGYTTFILTDYPLALFAGMVALSVVAVLFANALDKPGIFACGAFMNITTFGIWLFNSPVLGRAVQLQTSPDFSPLVLVAVMLVIGAGSLYREEESEERIIIPLSSAINGTGTYLLLLFTTFAAIKTHTTIFHLAAHVALLAIATAFWVRNKSKYSTFIYAMTGYMALTVAIIRQFPSPDYFIWLSWQSVVVVATAVWFRSRFIVVANFFIYLILFGAYLLLAGTVSLISLSFGAVALLTARILNAYKHRLELTTELMRNAYLACTFVIFPYTLYHTVPKEVVSLSWLAVAFLYYVMARAVKSSKYRWMALLTLILAAVHVLAVDVTTLEPAFKILSFIIIGVVLLVISLRYAKQREQRGTHSSAAQLPSSRGDPVP